MTNQMRQWCMLGATVLAPIACDGQTDSEQGLHEASAWAFADEASGANSDGSGGSEDGSTEQPSTPGTSDFKPQTSVVASDCLNDSQCPGICVLNPTPPGGLSGGTCVCLNDSHCEGVPCTNGVCGEPCNTVSDCAVLEACNNNVCERLPSGGNDFCNGGGCLAGEGDCDNDSQCVGDMPCRHFIGTDYCGFGPGAEEFCSTTNRCSYGQGDCDPTSDPSTSECQAGLTCVKDVGWWFGYPSHHDVCM